MAAIAAVLGALAVGGELLLPTEGAAGLACRGAAVALIPFVLSPLSTRSERQLARRALRRA